MYQQNNDHTLQLLLESGYVTDADATEAENLQESDETITETLIRLEKVTEENVAMVIAQNGHLDYVDLSQISIHPDLLGYVDKDTASRYKVVPVEFENGLLKIAIQNPFDFDTLDNLRLVIQAELEFVCSTKTQLTEALETYYDIRPESANTISIPETDDGISVDEGDAPIIKLVSELIGDAVSARASDIHIEPLEESVRIRYRIDGCLHKIANHPRRLLSSIIARTKIMSGSMSIAEKRLPQDGRIQLHNNRQPVDLRVSSVPTNHGESIVMRILDKSALTLGLPQLGFFSDDQATFQKLITLPDGILLVTGPTGSGKTTTLYACLHYVNKPDRKIITVEDPVEYQLSGINQVMVKESIGMTFGNALRAILRQAPNIVMIGEIRDEETAEIAIQASLTGHLVLSTLHTNDAPGAVARLSDIGVKPFLISSAVRAVMAQRLVRKLCEECKQPGSLTDKQMRGLSLDMSQVAGSQIMDPVGCPKCRQGGYRGRMGIFEIFVIDDEARHMINDNLSTPAIRRRARELGMRTLREDGVRKVLAGSTSADEVIHATMSDSH